MEKQIFPWGDNRRFNSYASYFRRILGERVQKVTIDAGFTCPNRDGTAGKGGCTYCDNSSFNPSYCMPRKTIAEQIKTGIEFHHNRYRKANKFLAYFQAYSNTYAPIEHLKKLYSQALEYPGVVGIVIGTRPDCIDEQKLDYLQQLSEKYHVVVEYGVESCYNKTLKRINRCHTFECSVKAIEQTHKRGIHTGIHIMFGLPGETKEEMLKEAEIISALPINSVKFHQLQLLKNTRITEEYYKNPGDFYMFEVPKYINFIIDFTEKLNPNIVIERIAGEVPPHFLAVPAWCSLRNDQLLALFEKRLDERQTWQSRFNLDLF